MSVFSSLRAAKLIENGCFSCQGLASGTRWERGSRVCSNLGSAQKLLDIIYCESEHSPFLLAVDSGFPFVLLSVLCVKTEKDIRMND